MINNAIKVSIINPYNSCVAKGLLSSVLQLSVELVSVINVERSYYSARCYCGVNDY